MPSLQPDNLDFTLTERKYQVADLDHLSAEDLAKMASLRPVVFIGYYISNLAETNLPTGQSFGKDLYEYIFAKKPEQLQLLYELYQEVPFEALMEACPAKEQALAVLQAEFSTRKSNPAHVLLASKLADGTLSSLITPNYDLTIDEALKGKVHPVVHDKDISPDGGPVYFKIHGTADDKDTIIYTLRQEGELKSWKYKLLNHITEDKTIIFLGYSGRDFDICPMIAVEARYHNIIWLHYGSLDLLSPYAHYLLNGSASNLLVTGDFCSMLNKLFGTALRCTIGESQFKAARFGLTPGELLRWQLALLDRLAYPNLGMPLLETRKTELSKAEYLAYKSSFCAHHGLYRKTARICLKRARNKGLNIETRLQEFISAAGTYSAYGHYQTSNIKSRGEMNI